jgi:hypothetical protein
MRLVFVRNVATLLMGNARFWRPKEGGLGSYLKLRVPANRLTEIINGKRGISRDTALRLSRYLGPGAAFWLNLQSQYDLAMAEKRLGAKNRAEVEAA